MGFVGSCLRVETSHRPCSEDPPVWSTPSCWRLAIPWSTPGLSWLYHMEWDFCYATASPDMRRNWAWRAHKYIYVHTSVDDDDDDHHHYHSPHSDVANAARTLPRASVPTPLLLLLLVAVICVCARVACAGGCARQVCVGALHELEQAHRA